MSIVDVSISSVYLHGKFGNYHNSLLAKNLIRSSFNHEILKKSLESLEVFPLINLVLNFDYIFEPGSPGRWCEKI